jgi:hypothetical protein
LVGPALRCPPPGGVGPDAACGDPSGRATPPRKIDPLERLSKQALGSGGSSRVEASGSSDIISARWMSSKEPASSCLRVSGASDRMASLRRVCASFRRSDRECWGSKWLPAICGPHGGWLARPGTSKATDSSHWRQRGVRCPYSPGTSTSIGED